MVTNLPLESWQALHQQLRGIAKRRSALDASEARCLREADALQLWRKLSYVHMSEYLERELGYGPHVGAERMRVARELSELPQLEASLADGTLSYSTVRELTRVATRETEQVWIDRACGRTVRQIEALVAGRKRGDWPDDPTTPELMKRVLRLEVTPEVFALFRQTQSALADEHGGHLDDSALLEVPCRRALEGPGSSDRPVHQLAFTVCGSCQRGWQNGAGREIEVGPAVLDRARCDADWLGSLDAEHPARVTATVTPRIRRQVLARDHQRCTVPGCRAARNLDLHHVRYQRDGGNHQLCNITTVCSGHHLQLHDGALAITGKAPRDLAFTWRVPPVDGSDTHERAPRTVQPTAHTTPSGQAGLDRARDPRRSTTPLDPGDPRTGLTTAEPCETPACADVDLHEPRDASRIGDRRTVTGVLEHEARAHGTLEHEACKREMLAHEVGASEVLAHETGAVETLAHEAGAFACEADAVEALDHEAREALVTAGYSVRVARVAVASARLHVGVAAGLEQLIRSALRCCARRSS